MQFYALVSAATLGGAALALLGANPISMLLWSAVINCIAAVPIMVAMMIVVRKQAWSLPRWVIALGWIGTAIMTLPVCLLLLTYV
jgi:Mn2+/Fe2+ NRAMP family transporter